MNCIRIEQLEIQIENLPADEKTENSKYIVDLNLHCDISALGRSDSLEDTVGYSNVCRFLQKYLNKKSFCLLETLAEKTAKALLCEFPKVFAVDLTIQRPRPLKDFVTSAVSVTVHKEWSKVYLSIYSNAFNKDDMMNQAIDRFYDDEYCRITAVSNFIESQMRAEEENYLNGCIEIETLYSPKELFEKVYRTEVEIGNIGNKKVMGMDILLYRNEIICEKGLMIPHTGFDKSITVLEPLNQIAPYAIHPICKKTISQLLDGLKAGEGSKCEGCSGCMMLKNQSEKQI